MSQLIWSWDTVDTASRCISNWLSQQNFKPDIIIGIARGGWIPARLIADHLNVRTLLSLQVHYYKRGQTSTIQAPEVLNQLALRPTNAKRMLIVDDIYDSGKTLKTVKQYIQAQGVHDFKIVTLATKEPEKKTRNVLDFAAVSTFAAWVVFPWDSREFKEER